MNYYQLLWDGRGQALNQTFSETLQVHEADFPFLLKCVS